MLRPLWGNMASRFLRSCSPSLELPGAARSGLVLAVFVFLTASLPAYGQLLLKPDQPGAVLNPMPSDLAILEAGDARTDLPCIATPRKADLGFDLRFHTGYDVSMPLRELAGDGDLLTVVFRVYPENGKEQAAYFVQHFRVPTVDEDAKGDALLQGGIDVGEGNYHVDWLMRDRAERFCSSSWDVDAALGPKEKQMPLFLKANRIEQNLREPFVNDPPSVSGADSKNGNVYVKLLVNFAGENPGSAALQRSDTDALVSILRTIQRDSHVGKISLVAFNMDEGRVVYRQDVSDQIDFPALGKALNSMKLGTVNVLQLGQKHHETDFLEGLIEKEVAAPAHPDAVVFAGPKTMLDADVPADDLRRIGDIECPVFYLNYNPNPQAVPWRDAISRAIRVFKGTEYTISRPRDLWTSTNEMLARIVRLKRDRSVAAAVPGLQRTSGQALR